MSLTLSRRAFLATAAAALVVPFTVRGTAKVASQPTTLNAYLRIDADGAVTIISPVSEMGQGTHTAHAAIIADELGVDISRVRVTVPQQPAPEYRLFFGQMRSVGSFGVRKWIEPLRKSAAQARTVLTQAAATRWGEDAATLTVDDGAVLDPASGRRAAFAELVADAALLPLPEEPALRPAATRRYVGKAVPRIDTAAKIDGSAVYGIDVRLPDMLHGAVRLAPVFGAEVDSIDAASAPGAIAVAEVPGGAVVIAESWWKAKRLADGLAITWKPTPHDQVSSDDISRRLRAGLDADSAPAAVTRGDAAARLGAAARVVEADYEVPFLTHVSMEPITCAAQVSDSRCEVWMSTQGHDVVREALEAVTGLPAERIFINTTYLGGGFGRKTHGEIAQQAVLASRAVGGRPVKVVWSREDDVRQGQYRPAMAARLRAALDADGRLTAMHARLSGPMMGREYAHVTIRDNMDFFSHDVLRTQKYVASDFLLDHHEVPVPPSLCPWRAVSASQNGFFLEAFIDEVAHAARQDPLAFRKALLADHPSHVAVLESVERRSNWGTPLPGPNWGRGVAIVESYGSRCAQVAEVEMVDDRPVVRRVVLALDCGEAVNPGQVETQMVGSVIDALGPALRCQVTLRDGRAEQSNFDDYPILRIDEVPQIDVEIVDTGAPIGGVGEPGLPPTAPAVANAIFAATGRRRRQTPLGQA
ncbi:MAG: molybdopterin-dependent oxidoreductase [Gammaproteobacteria bacterium]|nr:molybdopterin-dependent oxidoreductase [Gammaproteobacteria bacterium]